MIKRLHGWLPAAVSGMLQVAALAPWEGLQSSHQWSFVAWVAWIPVLSSLIPLARSARPAAPLQCGFIMGLVFWTGTIFWIAHVSLVAMLSLTVYLALFPAVWTFLVARLAARWPAVTGPNHLKLAATGAATWVALEWVRGWLLGGFPWNHAAVSQCQNLALIQIAEWTGVSGVSFLVLHVNLSLWLTWRRLRAERFAMRSWRYEFSATIFLVAFCLMIGMRHLLADRRKPPAEVALRIALVQPNIPQAVKFDVISQDEQRERLQDLTLNAGILQPDLIIWPETALVDSPSLNPQRRVWLRSLVREARAPILFGTFDAGEPPAGPGGEAPLPSLDYNAAMLMRADGVLSPPYRKLHLVPFGEYVPLEDWLPWLRHMTPIEGSITPGREPVWFEVKGCRLGPLICFEDTVPSLARRLTGGGADVLVNLTNDAWFKESPGAAMHAANAVFRAIENRRPLVRCSNSGLTCVIDSNGRLLNVCPPFKRGFQVVTAPVRQGSATTFYTRRGDWFSLLCVLAAAIGLIGRASRGPGSAGQTGGAASAPPRAGPQSA